MCLISGWRFAISVVMSILNGIMPVALLLLMQIIINALQQMNRPFEYIIKQLVLYFCVSTVGSLFQNISNYNMNNFNNRLTYGINEILMKKCGKLTLEMFETTETYDTVTRLEQEVSVKPYQMFQAIMNICSNIVSLVSASLILLSWNINIVIVLLSISILMFICEIYIGNKEFIMHYNRSGQERRAWYYSYLLTHDIAFKEIKVYGLKNYFIKKYKELYESFICQMNTIEKIRSILNIGLTFIQDLTGVVVMFLAIYMTYERKIMIGTTMSYLNAVSIIQNMTMSMASNVYTIYNANLYMDLLKEFLERKDYEENEIGENTIDAIETIEFKKVTYDYAQFSGALNDISLNISKGEKVAIVGKNGSGKSTLLKILSGLYMPCKGELLINGVNIKNLNLKNYRKRISVLFQDYLKYEGTLEENVMLGDIEGEKSERKILNSLIEANINFLNDEEGYFLKKELGTWFDDGIQLSGGQWQKIALARAYYKNADVYLLDEPSAALDVVAEIKIFNNFYKLSYEKIGIYITHRVKIAKYADKIIVMDAGKIEGIGTHKELLGKCKVYQELYEKEMNS